MESFNPQSDAPKPCTGGCGFFGSAPLDFYCSVCFKKARGEAEFVARTQQKERKEAEEKKAADAAKAAEAADVAGAAQVDEELVATPTPAKTVEISAPEAVPAAAAAAATPAASEASAETAEPKKMTNRCWTCKKKVGLTGFHCRCDGIFCGVHRYSDKHECKFDYKALGREQLTKANPTVAADKLERI